jgi:hypothetical protein
MYFHPKAFLENLPEHALMTAPHRTKGMRHMGNCSVVLTAIWTATDLYREKIPVSGSM